MKINKLDFTIMSGKNIFIGASIITILLIVSFFTLQIQQYNFYKQFATTKQVQDWVINKIKIKDKKSIYAVYCIDPMPNMDDYNKYLNSSFQVFWNDLMTEDWSQITIQNVNYNDLQINYTFAVKNIKNQKGEIGNRYFGMQPRYRNRFTHLPIISDVFVQKYFCFASNRFQNPEESYKWENPSPGVQKPETRK